MKNVRVNKKPLLETVKKNRRAHELSYDAACVTFHEKACQKLSEMLDAAKATPFDKPEDVPQDAELVVPINRLKDYDRVISMLESSVDKVIELTGQEYERYMMDEWDWKEQFIGSTMRYNDPLL